MRQRYPPDRFGIMGIGDCLIKMKIRYGSKESLPVIRKIFETLRNSAI